MARYGRGSSGSPRYLSGSDDDDIFVFWYCDSFCRKSLFWVLSFLTIGILPIVCFFYPSLKIKIVCSECSPEDSKYALVRINNAEYLSHCYHYDCSLSTERVVVVEANCTRYVASSHDDFILCKVPDVPENFLRYLQPSSKIGSFHVAALEEEQNLLKVLYGFNSMQLPAINTFEIIFKTAFSPFFIFQYFAVVLWIITDYILYSILILFITIFAVVVTVNESIFNLDRLRSLAGTHADVTLFEDSAAFKSKLDSREIFCSPDNFEKRCISDEFLLPGDHIFLHDGQIVPCDLILIDGKVVVDESMLTGESVAVTKSPLDLNGIVGSHSILSRGSALRSNISTSYGSSQFQMTSFTSNGITVDDLPTKRTGSILFGGTRVKFCHNHKCEAVVYRTGFRSAKGQLISSLIYPKEEFLNFVSDALLIVFLMVLFVSALYIYVAYELAQLGTSHYEIFIRYFDAIAIAVPPALTACLTVATAISIGRLKEKNIFVSDTSRINWAGIITTACFDKTGTLTEDKFVFQESLTVKEIVDGDSSSLTLSIDSSPTNLTALIMASCHNLSCIDDTDCGIEAATPDMFVGDPLELELLRASNWSNVSFEDKWYAFPSKPKASDFSMREGFQIINHFEFSPEKLRAGTLLGCPDGSVRYVLKGSPETLSKMSDAASLPEDLDDRLNLLAKRGLRVIGMAVKELPNVTIQEASLLSQDEIEASAIKFYGLLCLSCGLKPNTKATIDLLNNANIRTNVITGDHIYTAIAVATDCNILFQSSQHCNPLYIIDQHEKTGRPVILEAVTGKFSSLTLNTLLDLTALSSLQDPAIVVADDSSLQSSKQISVDSTASSQSTLTSNRFQGRIQLAVTGNGLQAVQKYHSKEILFYLIRTAKVFARTKPSDKKFIVESLLETEILDERLLNLLLPSSEKNSELSLLLTNKIESLTHNQTNNVSTFSVLFCGDGANDMSALRAATVGVSLCDCETSVAAPIASRLQDPLSVVDVIREGRCSLITAYVLIIFNILYGIIQLFNTVLLFRYGLIPGIYMYLAEDIFYTLLLGLAISITLPSNSFTEDVPPTRFLDFYLLFKMFSQLIVFVIFQIAALWLLSSQSFYVRYETDDPLSSTYSYEATTLYCMSLFQLMAASLVSTMGEPFRCPWFTNPLHVSLLVFQLAWLFYQLFGDDSFTNDILELEPLPTYFAWELVGLMVLNGLVCAFFAHWTEKIRQDALFHKNHLFSHYFTNVRQLIVQKLDNEPL